MNIIGVNLSKPKGVDFAVAAFWAAIGGLVGALILMPLIGGNWKHVTAMMVSASVSGLAAVCGASFDKAGVRGILICVVISAVGYGLVVSL